MREVLGVEPGSVTPFGVINDTQGRVTVVLDAAMMEHETLNYHPLVNTMTTSIERDDLVKFLESTGHVPRIERGLRAAPADTAVIDCIRARMTHLIRQEFRFRAIDGARDRTMLQDLAGHAGGGRRRRSRTRPRKAS